MNFTENEAAVKAVIVIKAIKASIQILPFADSEESQSVNQDGSDFLYHTEAAGIPKILPILFSVYD